MCICILLTHIDHFLKRSLELFDAITSRSGDHSHGIGLGILLIRLLLLVVVRLLGVRLLGARLLR